MSRHCGVVGPSETKEETTNNRLRAKDIGTLTTLGTSASTDRKKDEDVNLDRLEPYQGAALEEQL
jgi:hypothetical protein